MENENGEETEPIPKPYRTIFHPYLTIIEKIVSILLNLFSGFKMMSVPEIGSKESQDAVSKIRNHMNDMARGSMGKSLLEKWSKLASSRTPSLSECTLAESTGYFPFRKRILEEWNIVNDQTELPETIKASNNREGVKVIVRFPSLLLPDELRQNALVLEYSGCLDIPFDRVEWRKFAPNVPILVQFHGGGMVLGEAHDLTMIEDTVRLVENSSTAVSTHLITISVDYGLAPENPFPIGVMDALSVIDHLLYDNDPRCIHLSGSSAGANICLVAAFEGFRRYPGRILSIQAQCPFIDPGSASLSYYTNQFVFPDAVWLRWCWRAYLGLAKSEEPSSDEDETKLEKVLRKNSNYSSWNKWKADYPSEALHRLVNPALAIPEGLDGNKTEKAPTIIIRYNLGDAVHDDGKFVHKVLIEKTGDNTSVYEEMGLHCNVASPYNVSVPQAYWKAWSNAVFGNKESNAKEMKLKLS